MKPLLVLVFALRLPLGLDLYMPVPESNPLTPAKIALGRRLFFDKRLSRDGTLACSTCHDPERAFSEAAPSPAASRPHRGPQCSGADQSRLRPIVLLGRARGIAGAAGARTDPGCGSLGNDYSRRAPVHFPAAIFFNPDCSVSVWVTRSPAMQFFK